MTAGIGISLVAIKTADGKTPDAIKIKDHETVKLAIDFQTINGFKNNNHGMSAGEILRLYKETGMLIYDGSRGNAPMIIESSCNKFYNGEDQQRESQES